MATRTTGDNRNIQVELGRCPGGIFVARTAACRSWNMRRALARGTDTVVATCTIGSARKGTVIGLGASPDRGRFVAGLATRRGCQMRGDLASGNRAVMAAGATRADRHIGVELGGCPGRVALVAGAAICGCTQMVRALAGGVGAVMATGAVGGTGERAVINFRASPDAGRLVATLATCCR